jgi:amino acid adenylation domain-containing protein
VAIPDTTQTNTAFPIAVGKPTGETFRYPASDAQLEVWLSSQQSVEANCAYNEISSLNFRGPLDQNILRASIEKVVQRHESLRTVASDNGREMVVHDEITFMLETADFSNLPAEERREKLHDVIQSEGHQSFDLTVGPLFRATLQKISADEHRLTLTAHHIILDGWSLAVFCQDFGYFYDALSGRERPKLPTVNRYSEYAKKMESYFDSVDAERDETFWVKQFSDGIPVLDLPISENRPALRTYSGGRFDHRLSADLVERLRLVGAKSGCSLFNSMLASFAAFLSKLSGSDDFCIGIPTAGQAAMDQPELIGHCVNTMPLRTRVNLGQSFVDVVKSSRNELLNAFEHQKYSYGTLLRKLAPPRDPSRPPMLSVSFNVDPIVDVEALGFDGLDVDLQIEPRAFENFEWFVNGVIMADKSIELQIQFNRDLYSEQAIQFYFEGFEAFLEQVVVDPLAPLQNTHLMSIPQRQESIVDWNDTARDYPINSTLHGEFSRQANATPDSVAVKYQDVSLTYEQVETQSNKIARHLQQQGLSAGDLVGICVNRSERMLVYLYAILKTGAGYVPLDPAYPTDRLHYMCEHSGLKLVVTEEELLDRVTEFDKPAIAIDQSVETIGELDASHLQVECKPSNICYVIYTSGSTGKPKGVQVPHGAVVNFLYSMQEKPGFCGEGESVLAVTTLSFDIAVLELYLPTISGGRVVVADSLTAADGEKLALELVKHEISLLQATPATWRLLIQSGWAGKLDLKVLCGGEPMPPDLVKPLLERCDELWNMYGPTETTVWSAVFRIKDADAPILIGQPIGNTQIYVLDQHGNEVPVGCEGEVFIGGAGVTLGYRNQDDMTAERFVENRYRNPFATFVSDKLYKTGDLAKYRFDGNLQFLRRNDKQVKVRGFRIELEEIESAIISCPAVEQCVAVVREDSPGDTRLVAYVILKANQNVTASGLKDHVRQTLPYYMVPQHVVFLNEMPATNNGKIDFKALPAPQHETDDRNVETPLPKTDAEKFLASVWKDVLETDTVGLNDVFFDIGGHSLLVMQVIVAVEEKTGQRLGPQEFLVSTLEQMAAKLEQHVDSLAAEDSSVAPVIKKVDSDHSNEISEETSGSATSVFRKLTGFWD